MPIKISKAVKDLNIGMQTARDFLKKNEIEVDDNINARISDEAYNLLIQKFKPAMQQKKAAEQIIHDRKEEKAAQAAEKKRREAEESKTVEVAIQKPKVLGKIELDAKGNPVAPKTAAPARSFSRFCALFSVSYCVSRCSIMLICPAVSRLSTSAARFFSCKERIFFFVSRFS